MDQFLTYLFLVVSVILFSLSLAQIIGFSKSFVAKLPSLLFFSMGYLCLYYWMFRVGILNSLRPLVYSDVALTYLFGPMLFSYVRSLYKAGSKKSAYSYLLYLPAVCVFIFLLLYNPGKSLEYIGNGNNPDYRANTVVFVLNVVADSSFFIYTLLSAITVKGIQKKDGLVTDAPLRRLYVMLVISLFTYIFFFYGHITKKDDFISLALLINGVNCIFYLFATVMYPEYTQKIIYELRKGKKKKYDDLKLDSLHKIEKLKTLLETEKLYHDPELSVQIVSLQLGVKNHQLTSLLNNEMKTNFRNFINTYRIEEAKQLLADSPSLSILSIAYAVGFNSKSAFNAAFQRCAGLSPTEYRKNMS